VNSWVARHGQTSAQFQTSFNDFSAQGYLTDVVAGIDGEDVHRFTGLWSKN
jgi:hypothetical protein